MTGAQSGLGAYSRLAQEWVRWAPLGGLSNIGVSTSCPDCAVLFGSAEYSFHLRHAGGQWAVDTVNERGSRHDDSARFSSVGLAEKYLIWMWASAARVVRRAPLLGPQLYALGVDPDVAAVEIGSGVVELRSPAGRAVLAEPYATIFSHLMQKSDAEIEQMVAADL